MHGLPQATDAFCAAEGHCMDVLYLQGMSCKRWGGWERAMTTCINVSWHVLLVPPKYLIWSAVIVEAYPEIHLLPSCAIKVEACFVVWLLNKLTELSHDFMGAFRNEAGCMMGITD